MSCRVIGRNIEYVFINYMINTLRDLDVKSINAKYIKTPKNSQVKDFYDKCSFNNVKSTKTKRNYTLLLKDYKQKKNAWNQDYTN